MSTQGLTGWVRIARTGTFKDSGGVEHTFTEADFDAIKAGYNPAQAEAALCFGHPKDSDPAYGWVHALKRQGQEFFAQFARVPAQVKNLVNHGAYRYVSMSLTPDKKRLLHVGLLGAVPPAIDGLGPVRFNADGVTINFTAPEGAENNGGFMNTDELQREIGALKEKIAALQTENDELKAKLAELEKDTDEAEKKAEDTATEFAAYKYKVVTDKRKDRIQRLVDSGKLEPAKASETLDFAAALGEVKKPVNFAAPDGTSHEISAEERYFRELEAQKADPRFVNFSAPRPGHAGTTGKPFNPSDLTSKL